MKSIISGTPETNGSRERPVAGSSNTQVPACMYGLMTISALWEGGATADDETMVQENPSSTAAMAARSSLAASVNCREPRGDVALMTTSSALCDLATASIDMPWTA